MLQNRFKFNLRFKSVGEFAARICALAIYAVGARLLGTDGFGLFSLAFSYAMMASVIIDFGTLNIVTRDLARDKSNARPLVETITTFKLAIAPVTVAAICLIVHLIDKTIPLSLLVIAGVAAAGTALSEHLSAILSGFERMKMEAAIKIINRVGAFVWAVVLFWLWPTAGGFSAGMALGVWVSVVIGFWWLARRLGGFRFQINGPLLRSVLTKASPLLVAWVFVTFYANQDRYFLSLFNFSATSIGIYSASAKLVDALRPLPVLIMGAVFPIVSQAAVDDKGLFERIAQTMVKYSIVALFPFAFGVAVFSEGVVRVVFGPEFGRTAPILTIAIWGFVGLFLNHLFLFLFVSSDQQRKFLHGAIILSVVNGVLCWVLFQKIGLSGGAWALIGSEVALLVYNVSVSPWARRQVGSMFVLPLLLSLVSVALFLGSRSFVPETAAFVFSLLAYAVMVWRSKIIDVALAKRFLL